MEESFADYIKNRRLLLGLTQQQVADASGGGVSRGTVVRVEKGITKLPDAAQRRGFAKALGVRHVDILVALGELSEDEASGTLAPDPPAISAIRPIVERIEFSEDDVRLFRNGVVSVLEMMRKVEQQP